MDSSFFRLVPLIKTIDPVPTIIRHAARLAAPRGTSMPRGVMSAGPPKRRHADLHMRLPGDDRCRRNRRLLYPVSWNVTSFPRAYSAATTVYSLQEVSRIFSLFN
ncbi:hypothetical protein LGM58_15615 [Burkholderia contaminans]|uniref:hypothetical protein n=1 Tax=Burkholderia contaminans TaxID=488447 RepID=UPI001CF4C4B4|nr:hypothetical protein [Burkholderia contaminans]MCA7884625.1 hypothetical protein [Burkholderia contaminans]